MIKTIRKIILGIFGGVAIVLLIAAILAAIWVAAYIGVAITIFLIGYFLVTQYIEYKSDVVKKVNPK